MENTRKEELLGLKSRLKECLSIIEKMLENDKPNAELTLEELRGFLALKAKDGFVNEVKSILKELGAEKLSELPVEKYKKAYDLAKELDHGN